MIYPENFENKIGFDRVRRQTEALCATRSAAALLADTAFTDRVEEVRRRLEQTFEMRNILLMEGGFIEGEFVDMDHLLKKVAIIGTFLETEEIVILRKGLSVVEELVRYFAGKDEGQCPRLRELCRGINPFSAIINHIDSIIDKLGKVKDNASPELYTVRRSMREHESQMSRRLQQILSQAQSAGLVESDASLSIRDGRAVIPVSAVNKRKIKGFIHDESATGKTVYIEPIEVVELGNALKELEYEERREVVRILVHFTDMIRPELPDLQASGEMLTAMDLIRAKARYAVANDCTLPIVEAEPSLSLRNGCHPLLAQALKRENKKVVPLDLVLTREKHILVISGPNAGGKSVCLKTVGLLQYMLQCGFLIPALENSEMGIFSSIFIDIGDEQSLDNDLSTYSSHLLNMKNILRHADNRSLILIDEFGTGTEPTIGGAIAEAVLQRLETKGCFGVITTHYSNLKYYASNAQGIINGAMTFDVQKIQPLFRLETGKPGSSFAIEIARKIGLPEDLIRDASEKAGTDHINIERQLREIARDRRYWEQKRDKIRLSEKRAEALAETYKTELEAIKSERTRLIKEAKTKAEEITSEANRQIENTIRVIKESQADREKTLIVRREMNQFKQQLQNKDGDDNEAIERKIAKIKAQQERRAERKNEPRPEVESPKEQEIPREITVGVKVRIQGQEAVGEVMNLNGKRASVAFGQILTTTPIDRLEAISNSAYKKATRQAVKPAAVTNYSSSERRLQFSSQIDLRGMRASEALEATQEFVDEAIMLGFSEIRILHGKGTGALKEEIRNYLRTIDLVKSAKDEHEEMGGAGITVIKLDL